MRHWIHYLAAAAWGLATPVLMAESVEEIMEEFPIGAAAAPRMGHSTPVEFFMLLAIIGGLCFLAFLVADLLSTVFFLPKDGKRARHFFLALLLYIPIAAVGWLILAFLERWIFAVFS